MPVRKKHARLWSILDTMRPFHAALVTVLARKLASIANTTLQNLDNIHSSDEKTKFYDVLAGFENDCKDLKFSVSLLTVIEMRKALLSDLTVEKLERLAEKLHGCLIDEMRSRHHLSLATRKINTTRNGLTGGAI